MKKIFSILAIAVLVSCTVEKVEDSKDCECDRVTSYAPIPYYNNYGFVWTVNDCTNETKREYYNTLVPKVGECR